MSLRLWIEEVAVEAQVGQGLAITKPTPFGPAINGPPVPDIATATPTKALYYDTDRQTDRLANKGANTRS